MLYMIIPIFIQITKQYNEHFLNKKKKILVEKEGLVRVLSGWGMELC